MSFQDILDFRKELDVSLLDSVVNTLYNGKGQEQKMAQQVLTQFEESPDAWTRADKILSESKLIQTKFIGLQILEKLIQTRWNIIQPEQRTGIRNFIVAIIVENSSDEQKLRSQKLYLNKLNLILVEILKQEWPHNWPTFIPELVSSSKTNLSLCENNMSILKLLSEEVFDYSAEQMVQAKTKNLKNQMCGEFSEIYQLCSEVLEKATQPRLILATLETLLRFLSWIPLGYIFETNLISNLKNRFLEKPETQNVTLKCLTEIGSLQTRPEYDAKLVSLFLMTVESFTNIISVDTDFANDWDKFSDQQQEFIQNMAMFLTIFLSAHLKLVEKHVPQQQVLLAHRYLLRVSQIEERELFKVCLDYWNIFVRGLYEDLNRVPAAQQQPVLNLGPAGDQTPIGATEAQLRHRAYHDVLTGLRYVMISKMAKPEEVLIVENDEGEIVREFIKETDTITLYKAERECLIFLTHLDSSDMENIMLDKLSRQMDRSEWSWNNLNKLCWAIGSISGAMTETQERRFLVVTIKDLLNLCENSRGKDNKAVIAANIMYVVGQYPRFLKAHWKFLKTVTNKLFEFMHEMHEGVRDMACDTFIKIAQKCRRHFIVQQPEESRPFVEEIIENIAQITSDLEPQQVNTFYEAVGTMVGAQPNPDIQQELVTGLMRLPNSMWSKAVLAAGQNSNFLEDSDAVKMMGNVLRINVSTCSAIGKGFLSQIGLIYHDMLALYKAVSEIISATVARDGEVATRYPKIRAMRIIKKEALRLIDVYVRNCGDEIQAVNQNMLPPLLEVVLPDYASNVPPAREAEVLKTLTTIVNMMGPLLSDKIPLILESVFQCTLDMINKDFSEYPEHRGTIFELLRAINKKCFSALLALSPAQFKLVFDSIVWAFKHTTRDIADTGLSIALEMLNNFTSSDPAVSNAFFQNYFLGLLQDVFFVLTDSSHKSGFWLQCVVLARMFQIVESNQITTLLFDPSKFGQYSTNGQFLRYYVVELLASGFPNLTRRQLEVFTEGLFEYNTDSEKFRLHMRDFLIQLKEFAGDNADLYLTETERDLEKKKAAELKAAMQVPGMIKPSDMEEDD